MLGPAAGQGRTHRGEEQAVEENKKESGRHGPERGQPDHIARRDGQHVANQEVGVAREVPSPRENDDAERDGEGHDQSDRGIGGQTPAPPHPGNGQSEDEGEADHRPHGIGQTENHADGDAGESGMPDRFGKKGHAIGHHHGPERAEQRRNEEHREQSEPHELVAGPLERQRGHRTVPEGEQGFDHDNECRLKASRTCGSCSTSAGVPSQTIRRSRKTIRSAKRAKVARSCETRSTARSYSRRSLESSP